jgi:hypothetical protein
MNFKIQKFEELRKRVTDVINKKEKKMSRRSDDRDNFDNLTVGKLFEKEEEEEEEEPFVIDMNKLKEMPLPPTDVAPVPMEYIEEPKKKKKIKFEKMDKNILEDITFDDEHDFIDPTVEEQYAIEQNELKEMSLPPAADVASISMEYVEEPKKKKVKFGEGNGDVNNESESAMKDCLEELENKNMATFSGTLVKSILKKDLERNMNDNSRNAYNSVLTPLSSSVSPLDDSVVSSSSGLHEKKGSAVVMSTLNTSDDFMARLKVDEQESRISALRSSFHQRVMRIVDYDSVSKDINKLKVQVKKLKELVIRPTLKV